MTLRLRVFAVFLVTALAVGSLAGCGTSSTTSRNTSAGGSAAAPANASGQRDTDTEASGPCPTKGNARPLAKTRFALHAGLALGAFHRYVYKPLHNGGFQAGANGRKRAFAKAAVASAFAVHELKVAKGFAEANPALCNAVQSTAARMAGLTSRLKNGTATAGDLSADDSVFRQLQSRSRRDGFGFTERNANVPGAA